MAIIENDLTAIIGEERFIPAHIVTAINNDFTSIGSAGNPLIVAHGSFTIQDQFLPVYNEQRVVNLRLNPIFTEVDLKISLQRIGFIQLQRPCKLDLFVGLFKCRFKFPYSTDIRRGY